MSATDILAELEAGGALSTIAAVRARCTNQPGPPALAGLLGWVEGYLMAGHADLGRTGAVCPFTRQAAKLDTVRLGVSEARPGDEAAAFSLIRRSFQALEAIPAKPAMAHFRTVIVGFPNCGGEDGIAMLKRVQDRHKFYSLTRNRMIGLMYAGSDAPGLWNPEFRPLRAPLPVLAIRHMVEHDAPFAARHPLLLVPYLARFPLAGTKRLLAHVRAGA
jgi:acetyl esterase/lipase